MLVFCLALQTPLEQTQQLHPQTRVLAFADDCYLQGPPRQAAAAFRSLRDLAATIALHMQLPKCSVYGHDTVAAEEVAQELGIGHAKAGMMVCGTPLVTPAFITPFLAEHTERTCSLTAALLALPLATQDRFLVLCSSLQPRMDHLLRTVSWPLLQDHVGRLENTLMDAAYTLMHRTRAAGSPGGRPTRPAAASRRIWLPAHDCQRGRSRPTVSGSPDAGGHVAWPGRVPSI
jgi:hypothetical protein